MAEYVKIIAGYHVTDDTCTHGFASLSEGTVEGHVVTCPWHGWTFDVRTGRPDHPGGHGVAAYEVEVRRSDIYVGWIKA
jgi:nitrite reductase/ring-hydroxylating ferredoxin subunit